MIEGCRCDDCQAGRHLYALHCWQDNQWQFVGISLQSYASADECKQQHRWGIQFEPGDTWEDGTPVVPPKSTERPKSSTGRKVTLDLDAFQQAAERLKGHWLK